ncbi:hypothetical protein QM543_10615 [Pantoea eucrina]|nr:hypothetical protein [Pantoea eucrina]MDJ0023736.1 hypothetical protein [Pantoea eucrina]
MHAVKYARVVQRLRPVVKRIGGGIPAAVDHYRCNGICFTNSGYQRGIKRRQIAASATLLLIPARHRLAAGVLCQSAIFFRRGLIDQVIGGDSGMMVQSSSQIVPVAHAGFPPGFILPEPIVKFSPVILRPAHAGQRERRNNHAQARCPGAVEGVDKRLQIAGVQPAILICVTQQKIALLRGPLIPGEPYPAGTVVMQSRKIFAVRRQPVKTVGPVPRC